MPTALAETPRLDRQVRLGDVIPEGTFRAPISVGPLQLHEIDRFLRIMHAGIRSLPFAASDAISKRTAGYYREAMSNPLSGGKGEWTLLTAKDGEEIVGVLEAKVVNEGQVGFVHWVCTDPEYQQRGVGRALYSQYEAILRNNQIQYMLARINDANEPSLRFHESYGFNMQQPYAIDEETHANWYYKQVQ